MTKKKHFASCQSHPVIGGCFSPPWSLHWSKLPRPPESFSTALSDPHQNPSEWMRAAVILTRGGRVHGVHRTKRKSTKGKTGKSANHFCCVNVHSSLVFAVCCSVGQRVTAGWSLAALAAQFGWAGRWLSGPQGHSGCRAGERGRSLQL